MKTALFCCVAMLLCGDVFAQSRDEAPLLPEGVHSLVGKFGDVYKSSKQAFKPVNDAFLHQVVVPAAETEQVLQKKFNKVTLEAGKTAGKVATGVFKTTTRMGGRFVEGVVSKKD
ncbi:hypothetical protein GX645_00855 [Candidatus Sumerlaeota bacterium]|nr:hypothetical protein [Candidatus Sumerlaeota bacterium]